MAKPELDIDGKDANNETALLEAAGGGHPDIIALLLAKVGVLQP